MELPALDSDDARELIRKLCALEHRTPAESVVDSLLAVTTADGRPAADSPLWLTIATGQLNMLQGSHFLLARARLERLGDEQLVGYLGDWAARLPPEPRDLIAHVLRTAESYYGTDVVLLARILSAAQHGWRESDLLGILGAAVDREENPLALVRLRYALRSILVAGVDGLWCLAHASIATAVSDYDSPGKSAIDIHRAVVKHLLTLPPEDPVRARELVHHAVACGDYATAARDLAHDSADNNEPLAIDALVEELRGAASEDSERFDSLRKILWAVDLNEAERRRLAARFGAAAQKLGLRKRWTATCALLQLIQEYYRGSAGRLVEQDAADLQAALSTVGIAMCKRALGDEAMAATQLEIAGRTAQELIERAGVGRQIATVKATQRYGREPDLVFGRETTLEHIAQYYDLAVLAHCLAAELAMETIDSSTAERILADAQLVEDMGPEWLRAALDDELPLRRSAHVALVSAWQGLFWLYRGSGIAAFNYLEAAHGRLADILSFSPSSVVLRRELALIQGRGSEAMLLAGAPAAAVHLAASALGALDVLCREEPALTALRMDRAFALRWLAAGWKEAGKPKLASACEALAAQDLLAAIDAEAQGASARRLRAWAASQPASEMKIANVLALDPPAWDFERPRSWTGGQSAEEAGARDPESMRDWEEAVLDGPHLGDWIPAIRVAQFAMREAIERYGNRALTQESLTITEPDGTEHHLRSLKPGIAETLGIDGEHMLRALRASAAAGDTEAQRRLGALCIRGSFGAELEREGIRWLRMAARAHDIVAGRLLGEYLLGEPSDPAAWAEGAQLIEIVAREDAEALATLAYAYMYGRGKGRDPANAIKLLERSAGQGDYAAAYDLGVAYHTGELVEKDFDRARRFYELAAARGMREAKTNLAMLLLEQGADRNRAVELLEQASSAGETLAMVRLAELLFNPAPESREMIRARTLLEVAANAGRTEALFGLGYLQVNGLGGPRDLEHGLKLLEGAAAHGEVRAAMLLGFLGDAAESPPPPEARDRLRQGLGWSEREVEMLVRTGLAYREYLTERAAVPVNPNDAEALFQRGVHLAQAKPPDYVGAARCYQRGADLGYPPAIYNLGYAHLQGTGVPQDTAAGLRLLRRAAESGVPPMQYELGVLLSQGVLVAPDHDEAVHWYQRAADQGFPPALHNLGWAYLQGLGVERDKPAAIALFHRAAATGFPLSIGILSELESVD